MATNSNGDDNGNGNGNANKILMKYPDRIPIILNKQKGSTVNDIDKKKYLISKDLTVGHFVHVIRKKIQLKPEHALFVFVNNCIPRPNELLEILYKEHKSEDGFLYMTYSGENTFGNEININ